MVSLKAQYREPMLVEIGVRWSCPLTSEPEA